MSLVFCRRGPDQSEKLRMHYNNPTKKWTIPLIMAPINTRVVRRSNALLHHSYGGYAHSYCGYAPSYGGNAHPACLIAEVAACMSKVD